METLTENKTIKGLNITGYKQSETHILCKILITPSDAKELCNRTKSGLYKNKRFHERFLNMLTTKLEDILS